MASPQVTSFGTPTLVRATSGSVTGTWGTGQNRAAVHLLVAAVTAGGTTASAAALFTPSGWQQILVISNTPTTANAWTAFYTKVAAGSDSAPTITATLSGTVAMTCNPVRAGRGERPEPGRHVRHLFVRRHRRHPLGHGRDHRL